MQLLLLDTVFINDRIIEKKKKIEPQMNGILERIVNKGGQ